MLPILALLGIGLTVAAVTSLTDDDDNGTSVTTEEFGEDADVVISTDFLDETEAEVQILVDEGEFTPEDAADFLAEVETVNGPFNVTTNGGNDAVVGSNFGDTIVTGEGDDIANGRDGDDRVELGDGLDVYGIDSRAGSFPDDVRPFSASDPGVADEAELEAGNDSIFGGTGDDDIADGYGSNLIVGNQGDDLLIAIDQDGLSPDTIEGGFGADVIFADEGDMVSTGPEGDRAADDVVIELPEALDAGYEAVTVVDYDPARDSLILLGTTALLDTDPSATDPVTVADTSDGTGSVISVAGVPVVVVEAVPGLTRADVVAAT